MDNLALKGSIEHVTICIPAHNASWSIERTLNSILAQDYPDFDVFVCDNASTDNTAEIVNNYEGKGVKYYFNPVISGGAEGNWNYALQFTQGPLIALYHADDLYDKTIISRQAAFLKSNPKASAVFTMTKLIDECDRPIKKGSTSLAAEYKNKELFTFDDLLNAVLKHTNFLIVPSMMTRKTVFAQVGNFDWKNFQSASDIDLYLRMAQAGPIGIIDEPLHQYRISTHQDSNIIHASRTHLAHFFWVMDNWLNQPETSRVVNPEALKVYTMYRACDQVLCATNLLLQNKQQEAKKLLVESMKPDNWITGLKIHPERLPVFFAGLFLLISVLTGAGIIAGKLTNKLYQRYLSRTQQSV